MTLYRIKDWGTRYENHRSKALVKARWVAVNNRWDSEAYALLLSLPDGPALFGVWIILLQVASRCNPRGQLVRDNGKFHTSESISVMTRFPKSLIEKALEVLSSADIGWLEVTNITDITENLAVYCAETAEVGELIAGERVSFPSIPFSTDSKDRGPGEREIPAWETVWAYAKQMTFVAEHRVRDWFSKREEDGWVTERGVPMQSWKAHLNRHKTYWEADGRPMTREQDKSTKGFPGGNGAPKFKETTPEDHAKGF